MESYECQAVKTQFLRLFCVSSSRTSISDPQLQHRPSGRRRRTYFIEEHGTMDGEEGYWVTDETSGEQGFMALYDEDHFLALKADGQGYRRRKIRGRRFRKGRGKGKGCRRSQPRADVRYFGYRMRAVDGIETCREPLDAGMFEGGTKPHLVQDGTVSEYVHVRKRGNVCDHSEIGHVLCPF